MPAHIRKYNGTCWTIEELRDIAIGSARHRLTEMGIDPLGVNPDGALNALDDMFRTEPDKLASIWYERASVGVHQFNLFRRDWRKWQREAQERENFLAWYQQKYKGAHDDTVS